MRRFRRLRANPAMRRMVCETRLNAADFIYPIFVAEGNDIMKPVDSMPTVFYRQSGADIAADSRQRDIRLAYFWHTREKGRACNGGLQ